MTRPPRWGVDMTSRQRIHLGVYGVGTGNHIAGWRYPGAGTSGEDFAVFKQIALATERGKLDFLFFGDSPVCLLDDHPGQMLRFEPTTLLAALAMHTTHVGLIGTASTSYSEPYNVARQFASIDRLSGGRAGLNVVTTSSAEAAANFGREPTPHEARYEIAAEFVEVVQGLWDSWEEGARILDTESGDYYDRSKVHTLGFKGKYLSVKGPLNQSRTPQGQPVIVQAGSSVSGQRFAARFAEVMFTVQHDRSEAQLFYARMKSAVSKAGRNPDHCKIMPGLFPVVGRTDEEARCKLSQLMEYVNSTSAVQVMSDRLGHDMAPYPVDGPVPELPTSDSIQSYATVLLARAKREGWTLRDLYNNMAVARGYMVACGSARTVADLMEEWTTSGAADGFILTPAHFPEAFDDFIDQVIPELQGRGLFRTDYEGQTLRAHLGLPVPENRYTSSQGRSEPAMISAC